jgi:cell division protein FtsQ
MRRIKRLTGRALPYYKGRWHRVRLSLVVAGVVALLGLLGWSARQALLDPSLLPVKVVGVEGELRHMQRDDLKDVIAPLIQQGLFGVDVDEARLRLLALPWIEEVAVRRIWPDKIEVTIKEFEPMARWRAESLVDARGNVFTPKSQEIPVGLPQLWGPEGDAARVTEMYLESFPMLRQLGLEMVTLRLNDRRSWSIEMRGGLRIELGQREVEQRFRRLLKIYPKLIERRTGQMLKMDLRYPNGVAVAWSRGSFRK